MVTNAATGSNQQGAVLIVSLMILLVMTLLGVTAMQGTLLEERMAGNMRDRSLAFQAAETALRDAATFIEGLASTAAFDGTDGLYDAPDADHYSADDAWTDSNSRAYSGTMSGVVHQPRYIIELVGVTPGTARSLTIGGYGELKGDGDITYFRITARGTGGQLTEDGDDVSQVILQSYYGRRL